MKIKEKKAGVAINGKRIPGVQTTNHSLEYAVEHSEVNGAAEHAKGEVVRIFGEKVYAEEVEALKDTPQGYSTMLSEPPTPARLTWAALVHSRVNGWDARVDHELDAKEAADSVAEIVAANAVDVMQQRPRSKLDIN